MSYPRYLASIMPPQLHSFGMTMVVRNALARIAEARQLPWLHHCMVVPCAPGSPILTLQAIPSRTL